MILQRVNPEKVVHYVDLGKSFQFVEKRHSPKQYEEEIRKFYGDFPPKEECFGMLLVPGQRDEPLFKEDRNTLMSENGEVFRELYFNM